MYNRFKNYKVKAACKSIRKKTVIYEREGKLFTLNVFSGYIAFVFPLNTQRRDYFYDSVQFDGFQTGC